MTYNKWPSPHGHAIASSETDKQVTKKTENVSCENLTNADVITAIKEVIRISDRKHWAWDVVKDFLSKIEAKNE